MTVITRANLRRNQIAGLGSATFWPGISRATPPGSAVSARISGGMGFGLNGLAALGDYATDASGNVIYDQSGNPVSTTDYGAIADLFTKGLALLNSQQVFQLNLQRAQAGLQPVTVPSPQINLGIAGISSSTLLLIGAGLFAVLLLKR